MACAMPAYVVAMLHINDPETFGSYAGAVGAVTPALRRWGQTWIMHYIVHNPSLTPVPVQSVR